MNNDLIRRGLAISYATSDGVRIIDGEDWIKVSEVKQSLKDVPKAEPEPYVIDSCDMNVFEPEKYIKERPKGETIRIEDGLKKARRGNYVIYDVDFLLDNLAREVNIMESVRQWKAGKGNDND